MNKEIEETIQSFADTRNYMMSFESFYRAFKKGVDSRKRREYIALLNKMDRNPKRRFKKSLNRKLRSN